MTSGPGQLVDELTVLKKRCRIAAINDLAIIQNVGTVRNSKRQWRILLDQKYGQALFAHMPDHLDDFPYDQGRQPLRRLVQQH